MNKPIAVLSSNLERTIKWLMHKYPNGIYNKANRIYVSLDQRQYVIISDYEQAYAWEFSSYLVAPDFYTLEDVVKSRIK